METEVVKNIPTKKDKEIELAKLEGELVRRCTSDEDLKTELNADERILITSLETLVNTPFNISKNIAESRGIKFDQNRYKFLPLADFIKQYCRRGKAIDRKGIGEDVSIMTAYFALQGEREKTKQKENILTT